jgi:beta-phosphoglucomutase-like phosphatase (HAD superfamily)
MTVRVRPHVARAVESARHLVLDFDGVLADVRTALGRMAHEDMITAVLTGPDGWQPRPVLLSFGFHGFHQTLGYLVEHEPDNAVEVERRGSVRELDAALTAAPAPYLDQLFTACTETGAAVAVISDLSEPAVLAAIRGNGWDGQVAAVAARQGVDLSGADAGKATERAADLLGVPVSDCLMVSGDWRRLYAAQGAGAATLGCECRRDRRRHLSYLRAVNPVVANLAVLAQALRNAGRRRGR